MVAYSTVDGAAPANDATLDASFALLAAARRRYALAYLAGRSHPVALADLAEAVAVREHGDPIAAIPDPEVRRIYLSLYHLHVPKLAEAGVIEYDPDRKAIRPSPSRDPIAQVRAYAEAVGAESREASR